MNAVNRALKYALPNLSAGFKPFLQKCASASCRPRSRFLGLPFRSEGMRIENDWVCSPDCFEEAARDRLAQLYSERKYGAECRRPRMPLGLSVYSLGYITAEQLQAALEFQRRNGGRIGEVLVSLGFATQVQITAALSAQWGHPVLSLPNRQLQVPQRIPVKLMELYSMLPIHFVTQTNKLVIGFSEFVEHRILSTIETMLGCTVVPCFITHDEFENQFQSIRMQSCNEEFVFDHPASVQEIARITRSYAWQIGAASASFGICCDFVWSRLRNSDVAVDLLSRI